MVILTSGTTGAPKGANRQEPETIDPAAALLSKIPLRARERTLIAAPMFHSWGLAHFALGMGLSSTLVLRRRFDPEEDAAGDRRAPLTALIVVPVMLQRMLELGPKVVARYDSCSLRVIAASGSALPGELAPRSWTVRRRALQPLRLDRGRLGDDRHAGRPARRARHRRAPAARHRRAPLDDAGREVGPGETGRIFVGNELVFDGYTGGGGKDVIDGLMTTGDVGHFDAVGRLFVDGRDDEMIVSGGENVFPREVEDALCALDGVDEVAAIGVADERFGQRLQAFVVRASSSHRERDVKEHVKANLAGYKVPRDVVFLDELPRNATGKVLKRELAERPAGWRP